MTKIKKHPAKFNSIVLSVMRQFLYQCEYVLDPFAGTGKIFELDIKAMIVGVELEPEWADQAKKIKRRHMLTGDFLYIDLPYNFFDGVATSPVYGNRMSDHHEAKDNSVRNTYRHTLGRPLSTGNAGMLHFGRNGEYEEFHKKAWAKAADLLVPGGVFVLNVKDFIRAGEIVHVSRWHTKALTSLGLKVRTTVQVPSKGNRFGENRNKRVGFENVICFEKPK